MRGQRDIWKTLGYTALLAAIFISIVNIAVACSRTEEMKKSVLGYGLYGMLASLPMVMISEKLGRFFSSAGTRKIKSDKGSKEDGSELKFGEFLLIDERPSVLYFAGALLGLLLSGIVVAFLLFSNGYIFNVDALAASFILIEASYILSKNPVKENPYLRKVWKIWALSSALWWGMALIHILKVRVEQTYPTQFWEKFMGIPPISMILFAFILFLFSSIFWHTDSYLSLNRGPVSALSIVFMAAGIAAIFPPLWIVFSTGSIYILIGIFIVVDLLLTALLLSFSFYRGGMGFMLTNRRIMLSKNFLVRELKEYLYDSILSVDVNQGFVGKHFDFGDLKFTVKREDTKINFTLYGVKNPMLVRNTVLAMSSKENDVLDEYEKKPLTSGIDSTGYYVSGAKKRYHIKAY